MKSGNGPAKRIQHVDATSSSIVESNMLHSFGHHVAWCWMMLNEVWFPSNIVFNIIQHFFCSWVWTKMLHLFGHFVLHCWTRACPLSSLCGCLCPWQSFTVYTCFVRSAWMLTYDMANEESFQSLSEESTSDPSANRKRKSKAAVENPRTVKSRRWCDAEIDKLIDLLEERPCLWDAFCKEYHVREKRARAYEEQSKSS